MKYHHHVLNLAKSVLVGLSLLTVVLFTATTTAAPDCKQLDEKQCGENSACSWVDSYERKDGRVVKAFCRTKAKRSADATNKKAAKSPDKPKSDNSLR